MVQAMSSSVSDGGGDVGNRWQQGGHRRQDSRAPRQAGRHGHAGGADAGADARPELTKGQLLRIACGMLGLMFGWATKTVLTTPLFRDVYGVDPADLGFVWLAGPLSGLLVQARGHSPVVGVISDHREGQGQRSFFFAAGTIIMAASLALLPAAGAVCRHLTGGGGSSSSTSSGGTSHSEEAAGTGLAVFALWALDLAMNASLVAIRAVVADCAPPQQQPEANTVIVISYGAGTFLGYGFGAVDAAALLGFPSGTFWKSCVDFWVAALVLLAASAVTTREAFRMERPRALAAEQGGSPSYTIIEGGGNGEWQERQHPQLLQHIQLGGPHDAAVSRSTGDIAVATNTASIVINGGESANACAVDRGQEEEGVGPRSHLEEEIPKQMATNKRESKNSDLKVFEGAHGGQPAPLRGKFRRVSATEDVDGTGSLEEELWGGGSAEMAAVLPPSPTSFKGKLLDMALFYFVPSWLLPVCLLLFFSWVGWFAIFIFGSDWVGVDIFGGDPSAAKGEEGHQAYEDGVSWASVGLAAQARSIYFLCWNEKAGSRAVVIAGMGCGPVTLLVRSAGLRGAFLAAVVFQATCLLIAAFLRPGPAAPALSLVLLAALGVPLALAESLPYMMVGMFSPRETHGQLLGKLNVWIVLAQLALTLCVHPIVKHSEDGDASVLLTGALAAAVGVAFGALFYGKKVVERPTHSGPDSLRPCVSTSSQSCEVYHLVFANAHNQARAVCNILRILQLTDGKRSQLRTFFLFRLCRWWFRSLGRLFGQGSVLRTSLMPLPLKPMNRWSPYRLVFFFFSGERQNLLLLHSDTKHSVPAIGREEPVLAPPAQHLSSPSTACGALDECVSSPRRVLLERE
ncbi:unnamed protein product [Ectocarpus sp. 4 AP-2014]